MMKRQGKGRMEEEEWKRMAGPGEYESENKCKISPHDVNPPLASPAQCLPPPVFPPPFFAPLKPDGIDWIKFASQTNFAPKKTLKQNIF